MRIASFVVRFRVVANRQSWGSRVFVCIVRWVYDDGAVGGHDVALAMVAVGFTFFWRRDVCSWDIVILRDVLMSSRSYR